MNFRILLILLSVLAAACVSVDNCEEEYVSEMVARFKTIKEGEVTDTTVNALSLYGIREGQNDSLLYTDATTSEFMVPLDPNHDFSNFVLQIDTLRDTLTVNHEHEIYMISYTCGFASLFTLDPLEYKTGLITKDSILNKMIDAEYEKDEVHIWLYL